MPVCFPRCKQNRRDDTSIGAENAQGQHWRAIFTFYPKRADILGISLKKDASLPDTRLSSISAKANALLAILEVDLGNLDMALLGDGLPICLEVRPFEAGPADLFGEETVFDRMVDVLKELAIDTFVDSNRGAIRINHEDGNAGLFCGNAGYQ